MSINRKKPKFDLRKYYTVFLEFGLVIVLIIFIGAVNMEFTTEGSNEDLTEEQEVTEMEEIERTEQEEDPPPPPRPQVPVEVPDDEVIEDEEIDLDAEMDSGESMDMPPPPEEEEEEEEEIFRVVEDMPEIKGGQEALQGCVEYPDRARRAGIEGTVSVEFVVTENGNVEEAEVVRSLGGGLDEEAIRCVEAMDFEPGQQRGEPVNVRFTLPVVFQLQ